MKIISAKKAEIMVGKKIYKRCLELGNEQIKEACKLGRFKTLVSIPNEEYDEICLTHHVIDKLRQKYTKHGFQTGITQLSNPRGLFVFWNASLPVEFD